MPSTAEQNPDSSPLPGVPGGGEVAPGLLQLVGFRVGEEEFGIDILRVREILRVPPWTRVPHAPDFLEGVMNLRGKIIPIFAVRRLFGMEPLDTTPETRVVVVETKETVTGLLVDLVTEVVRVPADRIGAPPQLGDGERKYISGIAQLDQRLIILLDLDRLIVDCENAGKPAALPN
jgi:purine-binding chemotaxis protein CheW